MLEGQVRFVLASFVVVALAAVTGCAAPEEEEERGSLDSAIKSAKAGSVKEGGSCATAHKDNTQGKKPGPWQGACRKGLTCENTGKGPGGYTCEGRAADEDPKVVTDDTPPKKDPVVKEPAAVEPADEGEGDAGEGDGEVIPSPPTFDPCRIFPALCGEDPEQVFA